MPNDRSRSSVAILTVSDADVVKARTVFSRDQYLKANFRTGPDLSPVPYKSLFLHAMQADAKPWFYHISVRDQYSGQWRFYDSANDIDGNKLSFVSVDRKTDNCKYGCDFYETMSIAVSREYLESRRYRGLNFKISGKAGERIVDVPPGYVSGFLDSVK